MNNEKLYTSDIDLVANAIAKAAKQEGAGAHIEELSLEVLAHVEKTYVGEIDASLKKHIVLELYKLIETHMKDASRDC